MSETIRKRRGMTLMELLIVMAIIGMLVALLVPATLKLRRQAAETRDRSGRLTLRNAILSYHAHYGKWPLGDQATKQEFTSRAIIVQLRGSGANNPDKQNFWEGDDAVKAMDGREYTVVINPLGSYPIKQDDGFDQNKTVSFKLN